MASTGRGAWPLNSEWVTRETIGPHLFHSDADSAEDTSILAWFTGGGAALPPSLISVALQTDVFMDTILNAVLVPAELVIEVDMEVRFTSAALRFHLPDRRVVWVHDYAGERVNAIE